MITLGYITLAIVSILGFAHIGLRAAELDVYLEGGKVEKKKKYDWTSFKKKYFPIILTATIFIIIGAGGFIGHIVSDSSDAIFLGSVISAMILVLFAAVYGM